MKSFDVHYIHAGESTSVRHGIFTTSGDTPWEAAERHAQKIEGEEGGRLVLIEHGTGRPSVFTLTPAKKWKLV